MKELIIFPKVKTTPAQAYNRRRQERARQEQEKHNDRKDDGKDECGPKGCEGGGFAMSIPVL